MLFSTIYLTPLGDLLLVSDGENLIRSNFLDQKCMPTEICATRRDDLPIFQKAKSLLKEYFAGGNPNFASIPLKLTGTPFQIQVWQQMKGIPFGKTQSYGQLAEKLGCKSARAIGQAVCRNPLLIFLPCHRVVGKNGSLTGYAAGIERKKKLLNLEKI